eukprot:Amastigsp_a344385_10.p3 type:complete len:134 gc:universal Amastigsp_a344385_10:243-644(+)
MLQVFGQRGPRARPPRPSTTGSSTRISKGRSSLVALLFRILSRPAGASSTSRPITGSSAARERPCIARQSSASTGSQSRSPSSWRRWAFVSTRSARATSTPPCSTARRRRTARESAPLNGVCLPFEWGVTAGY